MWCKRHRPGAAAGSTARRKQCGGSSSGALASHKLEPACTCKQVRARERGAGGRTKREGERRCMLKWAAAVGIGGGRWKGERGKG